MKVLHIFKQTPTATESDIVSAHKAGNNVTVINLFENPDYDKVVAAIEGSDKVFSW